MLVMWIKMDLHGHFCQDNKSSFPMLNAAKSFEVSLGGGRLEFKQNMTVLHISVEFVGYYVLGKQQKA